MAVSRLNRTCMRFGGASLAIALSLPVIMPIYNAPMLKIVDQGFMAVGVLWLLGIALEQQYHEVQAFLCSRVMVQFGVMSYSIYLWHAWAMPLWIRINDTYLHSWTLGQPWPKFVAWMILGPAMGIVAWYIIERPLLSRWHAKALPPPR
jgi:peptidoglycan/LPS O-acetylase OafA/YrhL